MLAVTDYMHELLAQRAQFINTFYACRSNVDESRLRLMACARLLIKKQAPFFATRDIPTSLAELKKCTVLSSSQRLLMLQLYALMHQNQQDVVLYLYQDDDLTLQSQAPILALLLQVDDLPLQTSSNASVIHHQLLAAFYRQQVGAIREFAMAHPQPISPLTPLYLTVLTQKKPLDSALLLDFIRCEYLHSHLFELYLLRLDEGQLTDVVNQLASDANNIALIINVMALSGYSKFIPFLARHLQSKTHTLDAHRALRILLGETLDSLMPDTIQFSSDEAQRVQDFTYYGAKIIHYWDCELLPSLAARILAGIAITPKNIAKIWQEGSQVHRRIAALHTTALLNSERVHYYACPETVL